MFIVNAVFKDGNEKVYSSVAPSTSWERANEMARDISKFWEQGHVEVVHADAQPTFYIHKEVDGIVEVAPGLAVFEESVYVRTNDRRATCLSTDADYFGILVH